MPPAGEIEKKASLQFGVEDLQGKDGTEYWCKVFFSAYEAEVDPLGTSKRIQEQLLDLFKYIRDQNIKT